nr:apolipoprotein N-acyltransferase [Albidovulum inexpectatum]
MLGAILCGAGIAMGQAPWGAWWLALIGLGALAVLILAETRPVRAAWLGWAGGVGHFAAAMFWIVEPFLVDPDTYGWMAPFALVFTATGLALFWAFAGWMSALWPGRACRAMGLVLGFGLADLARSYVLTGFPWALIGHVWIDTPVAQLAAWFGPVGLSVLTVAVVILPLGARDWSMRGLVTIPSVAVLALGWSLGLWRLALPEVPRDRPIHVRLVQPDAEQHLKWRADMWRLFLDRQMALSAKPSAVALDLIVWPETAVPFLLDGAEPFFERLAGATGGVPVAVGIQREIGARFYNSLAFADGAGRVIDVYDKWHLVPFGEYVPLGDALAAFGLTAFAAQEGNGYSPGPGPRLIDLGRAGRVLPLICYEAVFPQDVRAAGDRPDWILQVTNDGWFGKIAGPYQHLAQARLRAIEQGLPLLRAANTGISAAIDGRGRVIDALPLGAIGAIDVAVPAALPPTPYSRMGDWPMGALLAFLLAALAWRRSAKVH